MRKGREEIGFFPWSSREKNKVSKKVEKEYGITHVSSDSTDGLMPDLTY